MEKQEPAKQMINHLLEPIDQAFQKYIVEPSGRGVDKIDSLIRKSTTEPARNEAQSSPAQTSKDASDHTVNDSRNSQSPNQKVEIPGSVVDAETLYNQPGKKGVEDQRGGGWRKILEPAKEHFQESVIQPVPPLADNTRQTKIAQPKENTNKSHNVTHTHINNERVPTNHSANVDPLAKNSHDHGTRHHAAAKSHSSHENQHTAKLPGIEFPRHLEDAVKLYQQLGEQGAEGQQKQKILVDQMTRNISKNLGHLGANPIGIREVLVERLGQKPNELAPSSGPER